MARAYRISGRNQTALELASGVLRQDPNSSLAAKELAFLTGCEDLDCLQWTPARISRPVPGLAVAARLKDGYFHVPHAGGWKKIYVAGVNIGPATPGRFASEPPVEASLYFSWLREIRAMGANAVRVYALLPPGFYRALYTYNSQNPGNALYLFQEIWLNDPPDDNLFDKHFTAEFEEQIRTVVDTIHGRADLPIRRTRAGGIYSIDVSPYILGWVVGRELEPRVVITTNLRNPGVNSFEGAYLKIANGNPTEVWLTRMCNLIVEYEANHYNWQRPVCFVNWPPLDPLGHPTESRLVDEVRIRAARGEKLQPLGLGVQDDLDVVSLDEEKISPQPAFRAGFFALYHVYPFWPDFLFLDPGYRSARDEQGLNNFWGYLVHLKRHLQQTPLLVGEYGLSTSLGIAHFVPNGMNHGGLNEVQQGEGLVRLTENIENAGCAGGMIFEWIDEWWKSNWISEDFEKPFHRKALWHNDMNPEQSFGLLKFTLRNEPAYSRIAEVSEASLKNSRGAVGLSPPPIRAIETSWDPSALYIDLVLDLPPGAMPDWSAGSYVVALNTCDSPCGSGTLPYGNLRLENGANFLVHWRGPEGSVLLVPRDYNPYREVPVEGDAPLHDVIIPRYLKVGFSREAPFEELIIETNRRRYGRDETYYPPVRYSRSLLRDGDFDPASGDYDSLGQIYFDSARGRIRLRLSWGLLLVLDPTQGLIFNGTDGQGKTVGKRSGQIRITAVAYSGQDGSREAIPTQILAKRASGGTVVEEWSIPWPKWSSVDARATPKKSYLALRDALGKLTGNRAEE